MKKIFNQIFAVVIIIMAITFMGNGIFIKSTAAKGWRETYNKKIDSAWNGQYSTIKMKQGKIPLLIIFKYSGKNNDYNATFYKYKKGKVKKVGKFTVSMYSCERLSDFTDNFYRKGRTVIYKQFGGDGTLYRVIRYTKSKIRFDTYEDNTGLGYHIYYKNYKRISKSKFEKAIKGYKKLNIK